MTSIRLVVKNDPETGLILKDMRHMDYPSVATNGILIAHDVLEHQRGIKKIGSIGDELTALGGVWYCRGEYSDMDRNSPIYHTPHTHIASDIINMGRMVVEDGNKLHVKVGNHYAYSNIQDDIDDIINESIKGLKLELGDTEYGYQSKVADYLDACRNLIAQGYTMANKRLKGDQNKANSMFWEISEAVDQAIKWIEYEGEEFILTYVHGDAKCRLDESHNDYY